MSTLLMLVLGAFFGWHVPQPTYAKVAQKLVVDFVKAKLLKK